MAQSPLYANIESLLPRWAMWPNRPLVSLASARSEHPLSTFINAKGALISLKKLLQNRVLCNLKTYNVHLRWLCQYSQCTFTLYFTGYLKECVIMDMEFGPFQISTRNQISTYLHVSVYKILLSVRIDFSLTIWHHEISWLNLFHGETHCNSEWRFWERFRVS